jgi:hypothetical protein
MESTLSSISFGIFAIRGRSPREREGRVMRAKRGEEEEAYLSIGPQITQMNSPTFTHIRKRVE